MGAVMAAPGSASAVGGGRADLGESGTGVPLPGEGAERPQADRLSGVAHRQSTDRPVTHEAYRLVDVSVRPDAHHIATADIRERRRARVLLVRHHADGDVAIRDDAADRPVLLEDDHVSDVV